MANFQLRALRKAARILDSEERLRALLDVPPDTFARWMRGAEPVPTSIFLMIVDFLADMEGGLQLIGSVGTLPARQD